MQVVAITGREQVELVQRPDPRASGRFAVVRIHVAPMCTEYKGFAAGARSAALGHEAAGEVVEVGRPGPLRPGDRVVVMPQAACGRCALCLSGDYIHCQQPPDLRRETGWEHGGGTYAQYVLRQDALLVPIPEGLPYQDAAMACCGLGPTCGALQRLGVSSADTVVIAGLGPVGLGGVIQAAARGARVLAIEGQPYRAALGLALGAEAVVDPADPAAALAELAARTGGLGADRGIDCSGSAVGQRLLIDAVRRRGEVAFIGEAGDLTLNVSRDLLRKGLTLHGCWHYNLATVPRLLRHIGRLGPQISRLITHTFPLAGVEAAFRLQLRGECGKVLLHPWAGAAAG